MSFSHITLQFSLVLLLFGLSYAEDEETTLVWAVYLAGAANGMGSAGFIVGFVAAGLIATLAIAGIAGGGFLLLFLQYKQGVHPEAGVIYPS